MPDSQFTPQKFSDSLAGKPRRYITAAMAAFLTASLAGCGAPAKPYLDEGTTLSRAGFIAHPGDTTARYAMMNTLPPGQVTYRPSPTGLIYLYADPIGCGCVYMGSEAAYRTLTGLVSASNTKGKKSSQFLLDLREMAAENRRDTALWDWSAWSSNADPGGNQPRHVIGGYW
ncbi:hypothetical protein JCM25156A_31830 [Komagataeibacter kakiaceti JCM 25156]|uniref:hypothetical protein n=1 Tax=Komagataeibacter kakiaceti TaxID=943261 RepID=UPI000472E3F8|nr:hypothetical protein [Komagataeibacter kakiaceti]